jgi:hypothetical protein
MIVCKLVINNLLYTLHYKSIQVTVGSPFQASITFFHRQSEIFHNRQLNNWKISYFYKGLSLSWEYGSWIYNYLWSLKLWVWVPLMVRCTQYKPISVRTPWGFLLFYFYRPLIITSFFPISVRPQWRFL